MAPNNVTVPAILLAASLFAIAAPFAEAFTSPSFSGAPRTVVINSSTQIFAKDPTNFNDDEHRSSRRSFLSTIGVSSVAATISPQIATGSPEKLTNISDEELKKIILSDVVDKSFLVTADITRSVYDESAIFTDEIDVYTMDKWIKGTQQLFVPSGSRVSLVGDVNVTPEEVSFRFDEDLMFNIPFKPVLSLTGKVSLKRDSKTGLITSYQEFWDQSVNDVLKSAKFGKRV